METRIKVTRVLVLTGTGSDDQFFLDTDIECPQSGAVSQRYLRLQGSCRAGTGIQFVQENFPDVPLDVHNCARD